MKKKILLIIAMVLMIPQIAFAKEYVKVGDDVSLEGTYNGSTLHLGEKVNDNAKVNGINALAGQEINFNGSSDYGVIAGEKVSIEGTVNHDLFAAGQELSINGRIRRDANIAGENVTISGRIDRSIRIYANNVTIENAIIRKDVVIYASEINIKNNVRINGTIKYNDDAKIIGNNKHFRTNTYTVKKNEVTIADRIQSLFISIIGMLIVGFAISFLMPNVYEKLRNKNISFEEELKTSCIGFVTLFAVPIVCILLLITLFAAPISLITLALYAIGIYISYILAGYVIGHNLITKVFKKEENEYLSILIGVVIIKLIPYLPSVLSSLLGMIIILYGMGLIVYLFPKKNKN